jgi:hypothetical protein
MDFKQSDDNGNFKIQQYHQNFGYDLEATLSKHPIKELENETYKSNLIDSLKKGNLQSATFQNEGSEQKQYIEANPRFKTINIYDSNMQGWITASPRRKNNRKHKAALLNRSIKVSSSRLQMKLRTYRRLRRKERDPP